MFDAEFVKQSYEHRAGVVPHKRRVARHKSRSPNRLPWRLNDFFHARTDKNQTSEAEINSEEPDECLRLLLHGYESTNTIRNYELRINAFRRKAGIPLGGKCTNYCNMKKVSKWKILKTKTAFKNRWWDIVDETVLLPSGGTAHFFVNHNLGGVMVFPVTAKGEVLLVRQYKHGARRILLELPVGRIEKRDPSPLAAARRELREETGYEPRLMKFVRSFQIFSTSSTGKFWLYAALGCRLVGRPKNTPKEITEVIAMPLRDFGKLLAAGKLNSIVHVGGAYAALAFIKKL
ncbi:NUDIX hydrolase [Patescibacteria group bacterium]|nr:MAG: NUDIX hydrolase [Patescibacteria group bacterium]